MKYTYIYLAGPMADCSDEQATSWRNYVMANLRQTVIQSTPTGANIEIPKTPYYFLNPMSRDYRHLVDDLDGLRRIAPEVVHLDKKDIDRADVVFVNAPKPSVGTSMEILYAWEKAKIVVTVVPEQAMISPWIVYHSTTVLRELDEAIEWILEKVR